MMAFPVRFASVFARLRAQYDAGLLRRHRQHPRHQQREAARRAPGSPIRSWPRGAFADHVVHIADLIEALTGAEPLTVTAVSSPR